MSDDLYTVRVFFEGEAGCVKAPGVYRRILRAPTIPGLPKLTSIDLGGNFQPDFVATFPPQIQPHAGQRTEMNGAEIRAVVKWLLDVQAGAA